MVTTAILLIILFLLLVVVVVPHRVRVQLVTDDTGLRVNTFFLSFLRAYIFTENSNLNLQVYFYGKRIFSKKLKKRPRKGNTAVWLKSADIYDVKIDARYSTGDPFSTGIGSSLFGIAAFFIRLEEINVHSDFLAQEAFIKIGATANINIGNTLLSFAKNK